MPAKFNVNINDITGCLYMFVGTGKRFMCHLI
jgi:hypothetical protein